MHKSPSFQFYPGDFITGTLTLSTEEVGAYILLICHCWENGSVPNNPKILARIAKLSPAKMRKVWAALSPKFQEAEGETLTQPRIEQERRKQEEYRRRQSDNGSGRWTGRETGKPDHHLTRSKRLADARKLGTHTDDEWDRLKSQFNGCVRCGATGVQIVKDHIVPIYKGGSDSIDNIQPLCVRCNSSKGPDTTNYRQAAEVPAERLPNACSSVFGFQSSVFKDQTQERVSESQAERAGDFIERYKALHVRLRKGAHYVGRPSLDFGEALQLVGVYDDARLDKLAYVWLNTDHDFAQSGTRSLAKFRSMCSWCEEQLIRWEDQHGELKVAV